MTGTFNGNPLSPVYCVDIYKHVEPGYSYTGTQITNDGWINGVQLNNAAAIAFLLTTYAGSATSLAAQNALQDAIWTERYLGADGTQANTPNQPSTIMVRADDPNSSSQLEAFYKIYMAGVNSANLANVNLADVKWISPGGESANNQGLVTATPIPSALFFVAPALLGLFGLRRKSA